MLGNGNVVVDGEKKQLHPWLKSVYGWDKIQTYMFAFHKRTGKTLSQIRKEYMEKEGMDV